jgi:hypothetical protein
MPRRPKSIRIQQPYNQQNNKEFSFRIGKMCRNSALNTEPSAETEIKVAERFNKLCYKIEDRLCYTVHRHRKNTRANPTISDELAPEAI